MIFRGIEHVGITVPDHAEAVAFLSRAFGCEVLFSLTGKDRAPLSGADMGSRNELRRDAAIVAVSVLRFANGANIEVFEIERPGAATSANIADIGITHFSITVDNIDAACDAFADAGGTLLEGPYDLTGQEEGPGNRGRFGLTPWGLLIEFEQLPSPISYDGDTRATRWLPEQKETSC